MDAFAIVVGFAGVTPDYFYDRMCWAELVAIGEAYREDWEKTRLIATSFGGEFKLPWDNLKKPKQKTTADQRVNIGLQLARLPQFNKN